LDRNIIAQPSLTTTQKTVELSVTLPDISGSPLIAFVDSGATDSFISESFVKKHQISTHSITTPRDLILFDGSKAPSVSLKEYVGVTTKLGENLCWEVQYLVLPIQTEYDIILGLNFLEGTKAIIDFGQAIVSFNQSLSIPLIKSEQNNSKATTFNTTEEVVPIRLFKKSGRE
jgi:Retroviral aspartyl protease